MSASSVSDTVGVPLPPFPGDGKETIPPAQTAAMTQQEEKENKQGSSEAEIIENEGRKSYFALRRRWSTWIIGWITSLVVFNIILTVGCVIWVLCSAQAAAHFAILRWFIIAVTVETFLQIVAMGHIAVKFLFSERIPLHKKS